jgi:hypothetical protein
MRNRSSLWRTLGALMALWVCAVQMEPAALHVCAKHSPAAIDSVEQPSAHHHGSPADAPSTEEESTSECCTCPDGCALAVAVQVPVASELVIPATRAIVSRAPAPRVEVRPASAARLLPFANGPPIA